MKGNRPQKGFVWIVGAGPGDARLLTLRAKRCLEQADVIVYDRLVSPSVLSLARPDAEFIYAGKTPKGEKTPQEWINEVLVAKAKEGKKVVRLKNGDPFVFGRGAEEAEALFDAGVPFEIVPGVTSAVAVPAYAGIPLTDRRYSSSFAVGVGKKAKGEVQNCSGDFQKLAQADTVVVLMAVEEMEKVTQQLMEGGKPPETPAAIIEWGATPDQKVVVSTLANLPEDARKQKVQPPAVLVVGEVVKFRKKLLWYERKPLFGKRVLVAHADGEKPPSEELEDLGAEVVSLPVAKVEPKENDPLLQKTVAELLKGNYQWVVFSDQHAVKTFFDALNRRGLDLRAFPSIKFAAFGSPAEKALKQRGVVPDFSSEHFNGKGSTDLLSLKVARQRNRVRFLLWSGEGEGEFLAKRLSGLGMVDRVCAYRIAPNPLPESFLDAVLKEPVQIVVFSPLSLAMVKALFEVLGAERARRVLDNAEVLANSDSTGRITGTAKPSAFLSRYAHSLHQTPTSAP